MAENYKIEPFRYNFHTDANNIKLPGSMCGLHPNYLGKTRFTHNIRGISNDKCVVYCPQHS